MYHGKQQFEELQAETLRKTTNPVEKQKVNTFPPNKFVKVITYCNYYIIMAVVINKYPHSSTFYIPFACSVKVVFLSAVDSYMVVFKVQTFSSKNGLCHVASCL